MLRLVFLFLACLLNFGICLQCHKCSGADGIPSFATSAINELNITDVPYSGDCKATSGDSVCSNGLFCLKKNVQYKLNKVGFSWNAYTLDCANVRVDNNGIPLDQCYDISSTDMDGYKKIERHCYCQKDFCNPAAASLFLSALTVLSASWLL